MLTPSIQRPIQRPVFQVACSAAIAFLLLPTSFQAVSAQEVDIATEARASRERLAAAIASVDGAELRARLLNSADNPRLTRWYAGEVLIGDQWLTLEQAEQQFANDKQLKAYNALRNQSNDRLTDHEKLARWCKKLTWPTCTGCMSCDSTAIIGPRSVRSTLPGTEACS